MGNIVPILPPMSPTTVQCLANLEKHNLKIRNAFYQRYTYVPKAQWPGREAVVAQLAQQYYLSDKTVEKVLWVPSK